jgi:hypothetical protein
MMCAFFEVPHTRRAQNTNLNYSSLISFDPESCKRTVQ